MLEKHVKNQRHITTCQMTFATRKVSAYPNIGTESSERRHGIIIIIPGLGVVFGYKKIVNYLLNPPNYDLLYLKDINDNVLSNPGLGDGFEEVYKALSHCIKSRQRFYNLINLTEGTSRNVLS